MAGNTTTATSGTGLLKNYIQWLNFGAGGVPPLIGSLTFTNSIPNVGNFSCNISSTYSPIGSFGNWAAIAAFGALANGYQGMTTPSLFATGNTGTGFATLTFNNFNITDFSGNSIKSRFTFIAATNDNIAAGATLMTSRFQNYYTDGGAWNSIGQFTNPANSTTPYSYITGVGTQQVSNLPNIPLSGNAYLSVVVGTKTPTQVITDAHAFAGGTSVSMAYGLLIDAVNTSKQVNLTQAGIGSVLTYTIPITNVSLDTLTNAVLIDTLPAGVTFNSNSLKFNGVTQPNPIFPNISLPDLGSGSVQTVSFQVTVVSVPSGNAVVNNGTVTGLWTTIPARSITNQVVTTINFATLTTTKAVDKTTAKGGDTLTYTIVLTNSGTVSATSIILNDTLPATTSFVSVSGATGTPPNFTVANIGPGKSTTVTLKVLLATVPNNPILNDSTASYYYFLNGGTTGTTLPGATVSNQVSTSTGNATINSMTKTVDRSYGTLGDTLVYSLAFINTGNISATNVLLIDTIPNNTSFIPNSMYVNNVLQSGLNPNPPGALIGTIPAGQVTTVTFSVTVTTLPAVNPIKNQGVLSYTSASTTVPSLVSSNIVSTTINYSSLSSLKTVSNAYANIGQVLTYTIPITNSGNTTANNIVFLDTIPNGTSLIVGSFKQDGVTVTGTPNTGVTLPNSLKAGGVTTVTFQVVVTTVPVPNPIQNTASASGSFTIDSTTIPNRAGIIGTNTNTVTTQVNFASLDGITKSVDKNYGTCGDLLTYTILVPNKGTVTAQNVILKDTIPNGTGFVSNSVYVNGSQQLGANLSTGVTIPNIAPGNIATITFSVQVQC